MPYSGGRSIALAIAAQITLVAALATPVAFAAPLPAAPVAPDFGATAASDDARLAAQWALAAGDAGGRPFAIVDKRDARLYVFDARGRLVGAAPALLGSAPGDHSVPGVGDIPVERIPPQDRTTPAGRFASEPGRHISGDPVVWFDYDAALSIHRVRPGPPQERRLQRLAGTSARERRASYGCVVVAGEFFDTIVRPVLGRGAGVVYVLPETRPVQALFQRGTQLAEARR